MFYSDYLLFLKLNIKINFIVNIFLNIFKDKNFMRDYKFQFYVININICMYLLIMFLIYIDLYVGIAEILQFEGCVFGRGDYQFLGVVGFYVS